MNQLSGTDPNFTPDKRNQPDWNILRVPHLAELPGIRWKLHNLGQLAKLSPKKFVTQAEALERLLES